jgi:CelD/BcsL family acetyltransferase involved in cellulose biosynthesis
MKRVSALGFHHGEMVVEMRPVAGLDSTMIDRWQRLADDAVEPNPFFEPRFVLPAARALDGGRAAHLVTVTSRGELVLAMPAMVGRWRGALPAVAGWRHQYCFLGTPLLRAQHDPREVARSLLTGLPRVAGQRTLVLEQLTDGGPVATGLRSAADDLGWRVALDVRKERAFLSRREDGRYLTHHNHRRRKELGRLRRRLADEVAAEVTAREVANDPDAPRRFMRVEERGWKGRGGTAIASVPAEAEMFDDICAGFRDRGRLEMLELWAGDRLVAVQCNLVAGPGVFTFKIAFDETYGRFSPGVLLAVDNLDQFHRGSGDWMDSCADPDHSMINHLWLERRRLTSLALTAPGVVGSVSGLALRTAGRLHQRRREQLR